MQEKGTSNCFKAMKQDNEGVSALKKNSLCDMMETAFKDKKMMNSYLGF